MDPGSIANPAPSTSYPRPERSPQFDNGAAVALTVLREGIAGACSFFRTDAAVAATRPA